MYTLLLLIVLAGSACSNRNQAPPEIWRVLVAKKDGFKMEYPKNWTLKEWEGDTRLLLLAPMDVEGFANNFSMMKQDVKDVGISDLDGFDELSRRQIKTAYGMDTHLKMKRGILKGYHSSEYRFSNEFRGLDMKWRQWVILKGQTAYIFTYAATSDTFKRDLETAKDMLTSFKFTGQLG